MRFCGPLFIQRTYVQLKRRITKRGWIGLLMFVWLLVRILALFKR